MDAKFRQSAKQAAAEIARMGPALFAAVLDAALHSKGILSLRCAEACARSLKLEPSLSKDRSSDIISAVLGGPRGEIRYFLSAMLIHTTVTGPAALKCAMTIRRWSNEPASRGAKASYLEAIAHLSSGNKKVKPIAAGMLNAALKSTIPSYSARARQIIMKAGN
jgi:hypothetical protein